MQDRQYECVDGYACDYMIGDYHYGHASDYGGRREGAAPKTIRCPTKLGIWRDCWDPASQATIPFVQLRENRHERHQHKRPTKRPAKRSVQRLLKCSTKRPVKRPAKRPVKRPAKRPKKRPMKRPMKRAH